MWVKQMRIMLGIYVWGDPIGLVVGDPQNDQLMELITTNLFNSMGFTTIDEYASNIPGFNHYSKCVDRPIASGNDWCIKCEVEKNRTFQRLFILFSRIVVQQDHMNTTVDDSIGKRYVEGVDECQFVMRPTIDEVRSVEGETYVPLDNNELWFCSDWKE